MSKARSTGSRGANKKADPPDRLVVQNVNVPSYTSTVERPRYEAMMKALMAVLPRKAPGLTQAEMLRAVVSRLPEDLFPGGAKAGWWAKCVQIDLEAKGVVLRDHLAKPLRWTRQASGRSPKRS